MRILVLLCLAATPCVAQTSGQPMECAGTSPDWTLSATNEAATFTFGRASQMTQMLETLAEGADWPRAYTYVGRGDSAIVMVERQSCESDDETGPLTARVLTQRGQTPVLLTGCCTLLED